MFAAAKASATTRSTYAEVSSKSGFQHGPDAMHTYTSIYLHVVFATWNRRPFLTASFRSSLHAYFAGTARNLGLEYVHVGGVEDHLHFLARVDPAQPVSSIVGRLKQSSSSWISEAHQPEFRWQRGFGAFSVSLSRVPAVIRYIARQEEHHRRKTFAEELETLLREAGVSVADLGLL
jgi:REP element-mobilizing transposase RayT